MTPALRGVWVRLMTVLALWCAFVTAYGALVAAPLLDGPAYAGLLACTVLAGGTVGRTVGRQLVQERRRVCPTCGGAATHEGTAEPLFDGRPTPVRGCVRCLTVLMDDAYLDVRPIED